MNKFADLHDKDFSIQIVRACGLVVSAIGFIVLWGWLAGNPLFTMIGSGIFLMAPSAALLFILFGLALFFHASSKGPRKIMYRYVIMVAYVGAAVGLLIFILSLLDISLEAERLGFTIIEETNSAAKGHMSILTAVCFVLAGGYFFPIYFIAQERAWGNTISFLFSCIILSVAILDIIAYILGGHFMLEIGITPPALISSIAFFALGAGLAADSSQRHRRYIINSYYTYPLILIFIFFSISIVMAGYFYFVKYKDNYLLSVEDRLFSVAEQKASEIQQWRKERLGDASIYIDNINFINRVNQYLTVPDDPVALKYLQTWLVKIKDSYEGYERIFLLDMKGDVILSAPDANESVAPHLLSDELKCIESGKAVFIDFHRDTANDAVYLAIMVPLYNDPGGVDPIGVLVLRINPEIYLYPLIQRWPTKSDTSETLLVRREGNDVIFLNELRFKKDSALNMKFPMDQKDLPAAQAVSGKEGIVEGNDYRGEPVIASVRAINGSPWYIVARMDKAEIFAPLRERIWALIILIGVLLMGLAVGFGLIWRQQLLKNYKEKYEASEALRESEIRYRNLLENMMEGCQIIGLDWRYKYVNDSAVSHGRQCKEDLIGHTMMERYPGIEKTRLFAVLKECMENRRENTIENEFVYPDGEKRTFILSIQSVTEGLFVLSVDITERKQAEKRIRHLNAMLLAIRGVNRLITRQKDKEQLIKESCDVLVSSRGIRSSWIMLIDQLGKLETYAVSGEGDGTYNLKSIFDQERFPKCVSTALGEPGIVVIKDARYECSECSLASGYEGHGAFCVRLEKDGNIYGVVYISIPSEFVADPQEHALFEEIADDISFALYNIDLEKRRTLMEKELKDSEERYRILFESAGEGILVTHNPTKRFKYANPAVCKMLGYTKDELKGMTIGNLHNKDVVDRITMEFETHYYDERPMSQQDIPFLKKDGTILYVDVLTTPKILIEGADHSVTFLLDVSERKKAEDEKDRLQEQLWQVNKMESIGRLSGGIAHDFNNILTTIIGNAEMALMSIKREGPLRDIIDNIRDAGQNAANLTHQILAFSRKQIFQTETLSLNQIVKDVDKMLRRLLSEDIDIQISLAPDPGMVETDRGQMVQVIMNLAVNAKDAMPNGGKLIIETASVELGAEYAKSHFPAVSGHYEMLSISDTGVGMSKEIQGKIFEPFFTTKEMGKGTGLGLSIVYGIIKQSNGYIWVYSEEGKGTTFKIYLPAVHKTDQDIIKIKKIIPAMPKGFETVLVVEDDAMIMGIIKRVLEGLGYNVLCATNGHEALSISDDFKDTIHLLLTDVIMPKMGGRELADSLLGKRSAMKVLFMSGYTDDSIVHQGVLEKGLAFIQKPFTPDRLARKVRETLEGKSV